jgi:hypothetical protein
VKLPNIGTDHRKFSKKLMRPVIAPLENETINIRMKSKFRNRGKMARPYKEVI